jgi:hypothetical protein
MLRESTYDGLKIRNGIQSQASMQAILLGFISEFYSLKVIANLEVTTFW